MNFVKFLRTTFLHNTSGRLLLYQVTSIPYHSQLLSSNLYEHAPVIGNRSKLIPSNLLCIKRKICRPFFKFSQTSIIRGFPVNFAKFLGTPFLQKNSGRLFL